MKDLLLLRQGTTFVGYMLERSLASNIANSEHISLLGMNYTNEGTCCEWLEVRDGSSGEQIGVCLADFYASQVARNRAGLDGANVRWQPDGAVVLLRSTDQWKVVSGPYLPVYRLTSEDGKAAYLVPEGFDSENVISCPLQSLPATAANEPGS